MKVGDIVKLKNPRKKGESKRRWRVISVRVHTATDFGFNDVGTCYEDGLNIRRLDTITHRLERLSETDLTPISFWERITRRW